MSDESSNQSEREKKKQQQDDDASKGMFPQSAPSELLLAPSDFQHIYHKPSSEPTEILIAQQTVRQPVQQQIPQMQPPQLPQSGQPPQMSMDQLYQAMQNQQNMYPNMVPIMITDAQGNQRLMLMPVMPGMNGFQGMAQMQPQQMSYPQFPPPQYLPPQYPPPQYPSPPAPPPPPAPPIPEIRQVPVPAETQAQTYQIPSIRPPAKRQSDTSQRYNLQAVQEGAVIKVSPPTEPPPVQSIQSAPPVKPLGTADFIEAILPQPPKPPPPVAVIQVRAPSPKPVISPVPAIRAVSPKGVASAKKPSGVKPMDDNEYVKYMYGLVKGTTKFIDPWENKVFPVYVPTDTRRPMSALGGSNRSKSTQKAKKASKKEKSQIDDDSFDYFD